MANFDAIERSNFDGMPVTLYHFTMGNASWSYCSAESPVTHGGVTYQPAPISNNGSEQSGDVGSDALEIEVPRSAAITDLFIGSPPSASISLVVRDYHYGADGANPAPVVWSGFVKGAKRTGPAMFVLNCKSLLSSVNRLGLRLAWGRMCPHALYDRMCRVNPNDFAVTLQIASVNSARILVEGASSFGNRYFSGGFIRFTGIAGAIERRGIESQIGNTVRLMGTTERLSAGQSITMYPGCNRVARTCQNKFDNILNFGGFPHMPDRSPFDNTPIF